MLFDEALRHLLQQTRSIALIGAKDTPGQPVDGVGRYLLAAGYAVYPVHPKRTTVWGLPVYSCLADLPQRVDIINLFRAPAYCPGHAREVLALPWRPACFWMQEGICSPDAGQILAGAGITVLEDICIMTAHRRLCGSLHG